MIRAGRPPLRNVERDANGQIKRTSAQTDARRKEKEQDIVSVAVNARIRRFGLSKRMARSPLAGFSVGRALLANLITREQFDAAYSYSRDLTIYYRVFLQKTPSVRAQEIFKITGYGGDITPEYIEAAERAKNNFARINGVLNMITGNLATDREIAGIVRDICLMDEPIEKLSIEDIHKLKLGLDALRGLYNL